MRVVVAGGGIAGLCAGLRLSREHDAIVLEREAEPGGKVRSQRIDGFLFEWGPNGFPSNAAHVERLVRDLDLGTELIEAAPMAKKRYVYYGGRLHALPTSPQGALSLSLLGTAAKLRALREPFAVPYACGSGADESVHAFFARRFGRQVADRLVAPALLGISGGDAHATSLDAIFPRLREMEREHGSILRAMLRARRRPGRLTTLREDGMARLPGALARRLGERLRRGCATTRIERCGKRWRVVHEHGEIEADAVLLATPADDAAALLERCDPQLAALLRRIAYAPMRVAAIGFPSGALRTPLEGFGFLVARGEGVRILGALYTSAIFPEQSPAETVYLRVFLGGAVDPQAAALDSEAARATVRADLARILGIEAEPIFYREHVWERAIPQYRLDHRTILHAIDERLAALPGIALTGNAYRGIGLADVVSDALAVANAISSST